MVILVEITGPTTNSVVALSKSSRYLEKRRPGTRVLVWLASTPPPPVGSQITADFIRQDAQEIFPDKDGDTIKFSRVAGGPEEEGRLINTAVVFPFSGADEHLLLSAVTVKG